MSSETVAFVVVEQLGGVRLDKLLADVTGIPRARLEFEAVAVNGCPARPKDRPPVGATVTATVRDRGASVPQAAPTVEVRVVYEDTDLVVVDKPAGMAVHPPAGEPGRGGTLVNALLGRYPEIAALERTPDGDQTERPGIVHRLDRATSGLMVVARTRRAFAVLSEAIREHRVHREYAALVSGLFDVPSGDIDAPILRRPGSKRLTVAPGGRPALTHYVVEAAWARPEVSALTVVLGTGRTHQIRVHMRAIRHPVVGDRLYGGHTLFGAPRQVLHSRRLAFDHPVTAVGIDVSAPLPADLREVLDEAGEPSLGGLPSGWLD